MADKRTTLVYLLKDQVSATAKKIDKELGKIGTSAKNTGSKLGGVGDSLGGLINPGLLAAGAVTAVGLALVSAIEGATKYAEVSGRLTLALNNSAVGWDGNRAAIDAYLAKQLDLGFANDDLAASLTELITKTTDVATAEKDQAIAMDLARGKGISLTAATDLLTKALDGNYTGLRDLGFVIPDTAKPMDAFRIVMDGTTGAAKNLVTPMDAMKVKMDALSDRIGTALMPALAALATFFLEVVLPAITAVIDTVTLLITKVQAAIDWIHSLTKTADDKFIPPDSKLGQFFAANPAPIPFIGHAAGGMVGLHGPELIKVGEQGPEYVVPNHALNGGSGGTSVTIRGVSASELATMVDREQYFKFSRSSRNPARV